MAKYACVHCNLDFEDDDEKPRCPKCMRRNGVETRTVVRPSSQPGGLGRVLIAATIIGALVIGLWWWLRAPELQAEVPAEPLSGDLLGRYLERQGVTDASWASLFEIDAAGEQALETRAWDATVPRRARARRVRRPTNWADADRTAYPLEVALLAIADARKEDREAMLAECWRLPDSKSPPDPSGILGYYVVAEGDNWRDPFAGNTLKPNSDNCRVLTDVQAVAAAMNTNAVGDLHDEPDGKKALKVVQRALKLDPRSVQLRLVHATILLSSAAFEEGSKEVQAAVSIRADSATLLHMANLHTINAQYAQMAGSRETFDRELGAAATLATDALNQTPNFAMARMVLAEVHLAKDERALARAQLELAERDDPDDPNLQMMWAQYHVTRGEHSEAVARIDKATDHSPDQWMVWLRAADIYRAAGDLEGAAQKIEEARMRIPRDMRAEFEKRAAMILGENLRPPPGADQGAVDPLGLPDPSTAAPGGGLADPSDLKLRDPGDDFELDLNP